MTFCLVIVRHNSFSFLGLGGNASLLTTLALDDDSPTLLLGNIKLLDSKTCLISSISSSMHLTASSRQSSCLWDITNLAFAQRGPRPPFEHCSVALFPFSAGVLGTRGNCPIFFQLPRCHYSFQMPLESTWLRLESISIYDANCGVEENRMQIKRWLTSGSR